MIDAPDKSRAGTSISYPQVHTIWLASFEACRLREFVDKEEVISLSPGRLQQAIAMLHEGGGKIFLYLCRYA